jgi:hypothetical protein
LSGLHLDRSCQAVWTFKGIPPCTQLGECPDTLQLYYEYERTPGAAHWIIVLLHDHVRRANLNGTKSAVWKLLCSVFQGCTFAPLGWGIAADPEARIQLQDTAIRGIVPPRTDGADDIVNTPHKDSIDTLLDNNCMAQDAVA